MGSSVSEHSRFSIQREVSVGDLILAVMFILSAFSVYLRLDTRITVVERDVQVHDRRITTIESTYFVPRQGSER